MSVFDPSVKPWMMDGSWYESAVPSTFVGAWRFGAAKATSAESRLHCARNLKRGAAPGILIGSPGVGAHYFRFTNNANAIRTALTDNVDVSTYVVARTITTITPSTRPFVCGTYAGSTGRGEGLLYFSPSDFRALAFRATGTPSEVADSTLPTVGLDASEWHLLCIDARSDRVRVMNLSLNPDPTADLNSVTLSGGRLLGTQSFSIGMPHAGYINASTVDIAFVERHNAVHSTVQRNAITTRIRRVLAQTTIVA